MAAKARFYKKQRLLTIFMHCNSAIAIQSRRLLLCTQTSSSLPLPFITGMAASKRALLAALAMALLLSLLSATIAEAYCTIKNSSSKDIIIVPVYKPTVFIKVVVGDVVEIPSIYEKVIIKNVETGKSAALKLVDDTVLVCVDGPVLGTIYIYWASLVDGVISALLDAVALITI